MPIIRSDCPVDMENAHHTVEEIKKKSHKPPKKNIYQKRKVERLPAH